MTLKVEKKSLSLKIIIIYKYTITMLYFKCPTCRTILANKQIPFEEKLEKICNNSNTSEDVKNKQKEKLLDELQLKKICCRMRMLTYIKQIDIVI